MMEFDLLHDEELVKTENGAYAYKTSKNKLLDLSFKVPELRRRVCSGDEDVNLWKEFVKDAYEEDPEGTLRFLLYLRDVRGGLGERDAFRNIIINMTKDEPLTVMRFYLAIDIPEYGRWDDVIDIGFSNSALREVMARKIGYQLKKDVGNMMNDKPVSLLAKWLPSEGASSEITKKRARKMAKMLGMKFSVYRKTVSELRKYLDVIERKMSKNEWNEIEYDKIPSKANLIYKKAFLKHDHDRRTKFLEDLVKGEAKINAATLAPYEIVHSYFDMGVRDWDTTLEELWKALPKPEKQKNILVVRDGSGSMTWAALGKSRVTPMDIADGLSIYMSQFNTGTYKDKFITFSNTPEIVDLSRYSPLAQKLYTLRTDYDDCSNTNLEAVFDLVLKTVLVNKVPENEIPDILIISDMEFDYAIEERRSYRTLMETVVKKWAEHAYRLPKLIFWNVASRTNGIPMRENDNGVVLVSGFTPAIANMVLSNELDPMKALNKVLYKERYDCVKLVV